MVIRFFLSAVAPSDVDTVVAAFQQDVVPVFEAHPDCMGVELIMSAEPGVDGLVEGGALPGGSRSRPWRPPSPPRI